MDLTETVLKGYEDDPNVAGQGLEIVPIKQNIIDQANEIGSIFVSFFTTFGLFSIGVGLLLIFLIFSMLAAERKAEMGMSRAIGMQRHHLVRMFTVEGAIYGIGSALVGAAVGVGLGFVLVEAVAAIFGQGAQGDFDLSAHVEPVSFITSFLAGAVLTLVTVILSSRRISRLNIVQAIRDLPDPPPSRSKLRIASGIWRDGAWGVDIDCVVGEQSPDRLWHGPLGYRHRRHGGPFPWRVSALDVYGCWLAPRRLLADSQHLA